jgi:hypothetical protein
MRRRTLLVVVVQLGGWIERATKFVKTLPAK